MPAGAVRAVRRLRRFGAEAGAGVRAASVRQRPTSVLLRFVFATLTVTKRRYTSLADARPALFRVLFAMWILTRELLAVRFLVWFGWTGCVRTARSSLRTWHGC